MPLGAKKVPLAGSLYDSYMQYAGAQGIEPVSYRSFGDVLDDSVRSLGYREIVTKRGAQGRVVMGINLAYGEPIRRSKRSSVVKYLMETEPWEGFTGDKEASERRASGDRDEEGSRKADNKIGVESIGGVKCVEYVECVDFSGKNGILGKNEQLGVANREAAAEAVDASQVGGKGKPPKREILITGPPKKPQNAISGIRSLVDEKVGNLTGPEVKKTEEFLSKHPRLVQSLPSMQEDWTEERLIEEAQIIL